jgi:hypothetical protein
MMARGACLLLGFVGLVAGCASRPPSRVRDLDGRPVPLFSVAAHGPVQRVHCADGHDYLVLTDPPPSFLVGASFGSVIRFQQGGIGDVCGRILSSWQ